jgi:hypothetical protein
LTEAQQRELQDSFHTIELVISEIRDIGPTEKGSTPEPGNSKSSQFFGQAAPEQFESRAFDPEKRYWLQGEIGVPAFGNLIRIVPVESTRDIHVVVEIDPGKLFVVPEAGEPFNESEENRKKREEYQAFKKQRESSVGSQ